MPTVPFAIAFDMPPEHTDTEDLHGSAPTLKPHPSPPLSKRREQEFCQT
jgi:hypothetical protein